MQLWENASTGLWAESSGGPTWRTGLRSAGAFARFRRAAGSYTIDSEHLQLDWHAHASPPAARQRDVLPAAGEAAWTYRTRQSGGEYRCWLEQEYVQHSVAAVLGGVAGLSAAVLQAGETYVPSFLAAVYDKLKGPRRVDTGPPRPPFVPSAHSFEPAPWNDCLSCSVRVCACVCARACVLVRLRLRVRVGVGVGVGGCVWVGVCVCVSHSIGTLRPA